MIDDPKKKYSGVEGFQKTQETPYTKVNPRFRSLLMNSRTLIPLGSGLQQVGVGLALVGISMLGLVSPGWLAALLTFAGSISSVTGALLVYHVFSTKGTFESLINQSIRRAVNAQN